MHSDSEIVEFAMIASQPTGLLRRLHLQPQRAVGLLAVIVGLLLCAMVGHDLVRDYQQQFDAANSKTSSLTQLLEEHARQSMRRVEVSLSLAAKEVQTLQQSKGRISFDAGLALQTYLPQDGLIVSFAVFNEAGRTLASTRTDDHDQFPMANDRDFILAHQDASQKGLFVGQAVRSRISGRWIIPVSVRLHGGFEGYLMGAVEPDYFQRIYQSIDTGENGFVSLYTTQGWAVARWPLTADAPTRNVLNMPLFNKSLNVTNVAAVQEKDEANGTPMVYSYRALKDYPLVVALGISLGDTLRPWRERALRQGVGLLLVLLFLGGSTVLLIKQLRRREQVETALQLSEISVLKSSLPTLWIGSDARILRVNPAACELHGRSEGQMLALTVHDLNPGMPQSSWQGHWQRLRTQRNMRFETLHRTGRGDDVPVEVDLSWIEFGGTEYNFAVIRDLTLRKQAEEQVQRSAAMLRGAIDAVDEAFVLFDSDDRLVYCNTKYVELYPDMHDVLVPGVSFEDLIRLGAARGLYRESIGRENEWIAERMQAHRSGKLSRIQKRDDGRVLRVIDRKTPDGNIVGIRIDITEMVRATEEAQEASQYKSQFLANMSHEIRTPMNAILGLLTLLQHTDLNSIQRDYAVKSTHAAQSLLGLLNDILDFSKVEAGKMELDPQPVQLEHLLHDVAVILRTALEDKSIELLFEVDASGPAVVVADAMRLQQVLVNLGGNAIKFTAKGQVVLRVINCTAPEHVAANTCLLAFSIEDTGIGIAPDKQQHIFSGFSQAEASTTRRFGGTGLGLAICKRLVELMGGQLGLQSELGVGSTFSFSLCLPLHGDVPKPALAYALEPQQVLLVDDNQMSREIMRAIVQSWNWPVEMVGSGAQALELLRVRGDKFPFDVIFLDWQMQGMDGWELVRQIRALEPGAQKRPRLVMLSGYGRDALMSRSAQDQALIDAFLFKPVFASELRDAALGRGGGTESLLQPPVRSRHLEGMRILVVEDNAINQQVAAELLRAQGAQVWLAANGQLGVDAVMAAQPLYDVVLMDIQMPVLDGYGATHKIREDLGLVHLPIVAMTANAMQSDRQACLAAGMNEHIGKPFNMRHLISVLLRVTGRDLPPLEVGGPPAAPQDGGVAQALKNQHGVAPYLDVESAVERLSGMRQLYVEVLQDFLNGLSGIEGEFQQAAANSTMNDLRAQMHTLKGTSATLGAMRLSEYAAQLEMLFRQPPDGLVALEQLPPLQEVLQATRAAGLHAINHMQSAPEQFGSEATELAGTAERLAAREFLLEISALAGAGDLTALERFKSHGHALDFLPSPVVKEIHLALQGMNLVQAQILCNQQITALSQQ